MSFEKRLYLEIGEKIKEIRNMRDLTQEELAEIADLKRTSITNIEAGKQKIQLHALYSIAKALSIPIAEFLPTWEQLDFSLSTLLDEKIQTADGKEALEQKDRDDILRVLRMEGVSQDE